VILSSEPFLSESPDWKIVNTLVAHARYYPQMPDPIFSAEGKGRIWTLTGYLAVPTEEA
jgi:hypothetical protein